MNHLKQINDPSGETHNPAGCERQDGEGVTHADLDAHFAVSARWNDLCRRYVDEASDLCLRAALRTHLLRAALEPTDPTMLALLREIEANKGGVDAERRDSIRNEAERGEHDRSDGAYPCS